MDTLIYIGFPAMMKSITGITSNIITLLGFINMNQPRCDITKVLRKYDLEKTIILLHKIIEEIPKYYEITESIMISLKNVEEIIEQIEKELKIIQEKIIYNSSLYFFSNLRVYSFQENIDSIEIGSEILERRKENLFRTISIFKK